MKLMVVAGFFGSGKTTFIINSAKRLVKSYGLEIAIIVNDIGEIGIDDKIIGSYGLKVKELFGGCVCCQLGDDMIKTLRLVERRIKPDLAILEPSGAADPSQILSIVSLAKNFELQMLPLIVLVDATQFKLLLSEMPLAIRKIAFGEIVLINKADEVSEAELSSVAREVGKVNQRAAIRQISAKRDEGIEQVLEMIMRDGAKPRENN
jgi:G3E family GTPase